MTATKRIPGAPTDDEVTVFVQRPSFIDEEAVTKVRKPCLHAVPTPVPPPPFPSSPPSPLFDVKLGDEPTRILDHPGRNEDTVLTVRPSTKKELRKLSRGRMSPVRVASVVVLLTTAALLGKGWQRAHAGGAAVAGANAASVVKSAAAPASATVIATPPPSFPASSVSIAPAATAASVAVAPTAAAPSITPPQDPPAPPSNDERAAVEAVASGSYAQAAKLYQALVAAHPNNDAYREAARILLDRSKESSR